MELQFSTYQSFSDSVIKESKDFFKAMSKDIPKKVSIINIPKRQFTVFDFKDNGIKSFNLHIYLISNH